MGEEYRERRSSGKERHLSQVTEQAGEQVERDGPDARLAGAPVGLSDRGGIKNETFNTLKNQGYEFEHNAD